MRRSVMLPFRLFAATGDVMVRLESVDGASVQTTIVLGSTPVSRSGQEIIGGVVAATIILGVDDHDVTIPAACINNDNSVVPRRSRDDSTVSGTGVVDSLGRNAPQADCGEQRSD